MRTARFAIPFLFACSSADSLPFGAIGGVGGSGGAGAGGQGGTAANTTVGAGGQGGSGGAGGATSTTASTSSAGGQGGGGAPGAGGSGGQGGSCVVDQAAVCEALPGGVCGDVPDGCGSTVYCGNEACAHGALSCVAETHSCLCQTLENYGFAVNTCNARGGGVPRACGDFADPDVPIGCVATDVINQDDSRIWCCVD